LRKIDLRQRGRAQSRLVDALRKIEGAAMPFDALILSLAICCVFALFAGVLAWVDHTTSAWQRSSDKEVAKSASAQPAKRAA
jgi:hypothetical protein